MSRWFVYILRCQDKTLYTGVTTDLSRRVKEHNGIAGKAKGAKYTAMRRPVVLVYHEVATSRGAAQKREYELRTLTKSEKERVVNTKNCGIV